MKHRFKAVLVFIVVTECIGIAYTGYTLYLRKKIGINVLSAVTVVPIRKEYLISSPSAGLRYFYEPKPNSVQEDHVGWLPYTAVYSINADSLNDRYNYTVEKPPDTFRIITLGDSFTFGQWVNTADNWTEKLENILNAQCKTRDIQHVEVINLGGSGYDVEYIAHRYAIRGIKYHPDLIIWLESGTGFDRLKELIAPLTQQYEQTIMQEEKSDPKQAEADLASEWQTIHDEIMQKYSQEQIAEQVHAAWYEFFEIKGATKTVIASFSNISSQNKANLISWTAGQSNTSLYFGIRDIRAANGVLHDGHPNREGHTMIAEDFYTYITKNGILTCEDKNQTIPR